MTDIAGEARALARTCTAIVLAGGRSARFGRDKLAEPLDGRPLLDHAIDVVATVASDVVLVLEPGAPSRPSHARFVTVHDPVAYGGPLIGLLAGLEAAREPIAIVVGGDMPGLRPSVLALIIDRLAASAVADAVVLDDAGRIRPLPLAIRVGSATAAATAALDRGARSLHALLDGVRVDVVTESDWRVLDPEGATLKDIDRPVDLGADGVPDQPPRPSAS